MSRIIEIYNTMEYGPVLESPVAALDWIARHDGRVPGFVHGQWVSGSDEWIPAIDPATDLVLAEIPQTSPEGLDEAVNAASQAQATWAGLAPHLRARHLYAWSRAIDQHRRTIACLETLDHGRPIRDVLAHDIPFIIDNLVHNAGWAQLIDRKQPNTAPRGVVGAVVDWTAPLVSLISKVGPALAAGNTVVAKPSNYTSLTALLLAELAHRSGIPAGVFNVVTGDERVATALAAHPELDMVAVVAPTSVGRLVRRVTAGHAKSLSLTLGSRSPFIVFDDVDLDAVTESLVEAAWSNQGQSPTHAPRVLMHESIAGPLLHRLRARMDRLRIGNPLDRTIDLGPMVSDQQRQQVSAQLEQALSEGAMLYQPNTERPQTGAYMLPSLLTQVHPASSIALEDVIGPVAITMTFRTTAEAIELANNSRYGMAATIWSDSHATALSVATSLECGVVWINHTGSRAAHLGWGGPRDSGAGRDGGLEAIQAYRRSSEATSPSPTKTPQMAAPLQPTESLARPGFVRHYPLYIDGQALRGRSEPTSIDTADGIAIATIDSATAADVHRAVQAARKASGWCRNNRLSRAKVLYELAILVEHHRSILTDAWAESEHVPTIDAQHDLDHAIERLFDCAAWADKSIGSSDLLGTEAMTTVGLQEPIGVIGMVLADPYSFSELLLLIGASIAMGNRVVIAPSYPHAMLAMALSTVLQASTVPRGVINLVPGNAIELTKVLAEHDDLDGFWCFGEHDTATVEALAAENLKRVWTDDTIPMDEVMLLDRATRTKTIYIPIGDS